MRKNSIFFCTRPPPGLLPVLVPLGSGTDATHQPSPALRLLGITHSYELAFKEALNMKIICALYYHLSLH